MRQRPKPMKSKAKVPVAPTSAKNQSSRVRDLEKRLAEAVERERAAGEILRVIAVSHREFVRGTGTSCGRSRATNWR